LKFKVAFVITFYSSHLLLLSFLRLATVASLIRSIE
jgi:hypothetical protein